MKETPVMVEQGLSIAEVIQQEFARAPHVLEVTVTAEKCDRYHAFVAVSKFDREALYPLFEIEGSILDRFPNAEIRIDYLDRSPVGPDHLPFPTL